MTTVHNETDSEELPKLPFRRIQFALHQLVDVAIPMHVQFLRDHNEKLRYTKNSLELRSEQVKAAKSVQLLKADLYELEQLNRQVREEDQDQFHNTIHNQIRDAVEVLSSFMSSHCDALTPFSEADAIDEEADIPQLVCHLDQEYPDNLDDPSPVTAVIQAQTASPSSGWSFLRKELLELNSLMKRFASLVFTQQEDVDTIQQNVFETRENVRAGTEHLRKASFLKAASFPVTGAVIGGLMLGPVGALIGFKVFGTVACVASGSLLGYTAGKKLKKKQQAICDIELKPIVYSQKASSNPELSSPDKKND